MFKKGSGQFYNNLHSWGAQRRLLGGGDTGTDS